MLKNTSVAYFSEKSKGLQEEASQRVNPFITSKITITKAKSLQRAYFQIMPTM